jgi:hypothetical protein
MDQDDFEAEVVALASEGTTVTAANLSAQTRLSPRTCETLLERMVRDGRLERENAVDGDVQVYRVRGLATKAKKRVLVDEGIEDALHREVLGAAGKIVVQQAVQQVRVKVGIDPAAKRNPLIGAAIGLLFGPFGLLYAAPWRPALISCAVYLVVYLTPLSRSFDGFWKLGLAANVVFAILSALYVWRFNRVGERAPLFAFGAAKKKPAKDD